MLFQSPPDDLAYHRVHARTFEFAVAHGVEILGTSETRYAVSLSLEWGRESKTLSLPDANIAAQEALYVRLFRSFRANSGFDFYVLGIGGRWFGTQGFFRNGYIEAGTGLGLTDGLSADINSHFNFVSYLGAGAFFSTAHQSPRIGLRWLHASNAGLRSPNGGLNQFEIVFGFRL